MDNKELSTLRKQANLTLKSQIDQLQMIPAAATALLNLANNENTTVADLSVVIETEPALAAQLLKLVNSAAYGLPSKITSISRAVNLLGFAEVKRASLDLLFFNNLIKPDTNAKFDQLYFWQHCLFVAGLSRAIAISLMHPDPDRIYAAGLLHDIGKTVLESHGLVSYSDFLDFFEKSDSSIPKNEKIFFGMTHSEMGYVFCKQWDLPDTITAVSYLHHSNFLNHPLAKGVEQDIAIVSFANFIAWMQGIGSVQGHNHPILQHDVLSIIDIEQLNIEEILDNVDTEMQSIRDFYDLDFPNLNNLRATLVKSTIALCKLSVQETSTPLNSLPQQPLFLSSLTAPHHSLNKSDFVPRTLEAIHNDFDFDRVMLLEINPKRRSLVASYSWPSEITANKENLPEITIDSASVDLLKCLRQREAVLITDTSWLKCKVLKQQNVNSFIAIPVLRHNRFIGIIYTDNVISQNSLDANIAHQIVPIANELGIALNNAKQLDLEKKKSLTDPLTNLHNRRMLNDFLENIYQQNITKYSPLAVGFIDIDNFKRLNDQCGHQAGDDALKIVADTLRSLTRPGDCMGRYGGEEFLFIHINTTLEGVTSYAERVRMEIERRGKILAKRLKCDALTISIGIALHSAEFKNYYDIIDAADRAMYKAKKNGRNQVVLHT